jgi:dTDP-4-dehydrorhamnose reductase
MKIMITGAQGQLGQELKEVLGKERKNEVTGLGHRELDVTKLDELKQAAQNNLPEVIIHAAANTNVDQCELDQDSAYLVNALGTRNVAVVASMVGAKLVYMSTDYVFSGKLGRPYTEFDEPEPLNVYGRSKLAGERFVVSLGSRYFIIRTSWLYGPHGKNFVQTMLNLGREKDEIAVVNDQVGSPTYTKDLANFINWLIKTELYGIYHASNKGECSWFDFARKIFYLAGLKHIKVRPVTSKEINRPAPRPAYSVLDNYCLRLSGLPGLRPWPEALADFLRQHLFI